MEKKVALVTGASRGIGSAIAAELAASGVHVLINYSGSQERARKVLAEIEENGGSGAVCGFDVSDHDAVKAVMQDMIREYRRLDILVNNAGITRDNLIMRMSEEDYDRVLDVNLKGAFHTMKHASRQMMKQRSGVMINITSVSGILGNAGQANYAAAKAGLIGLTKSMAREMASRNIRVNAVAPGFIDTEMTAVLPDQIKEQVTEQIPLKKFGQAQDVAKTVGFLASDAASYITGQVICVDGGMAM